ncbi:MAG: hypothetical protein IPH78_09160 [Bacteroidetes bacterium]|nr:hypothetical protein [Bacteroidota bacterium]
MAQLKVISYNVNGIRSALSKGFAEWLKQENPDVFACRKLKCRARF